MNNCKSNCGCKFEVDSSCVRYTAVNLGTTLINIGDTIETTIIKIDQAITNLQQTIINNNTTGSTIQISGPIDKVVKFGPVSNPLLPSQTTDDGTSIGINANPDSSNKVLIETSLNQSGLKVSSLNNGKEAIIASSQASGSIVNKGIVSLVSGSTVSNIGTETSATGASNINVGISSTAIGGTSNYSAQLKDGSETTQGGKFLKDTGSGKAKWNYIYLADIQDYQAPTSFSLPIATNTILGGIKVGNGLSITSQGVLSSNIGQGTLNYIAKFTPDGYSIDDSQIIDDGNAIAINTTIDSSSKINISSGLPSAIRIDNTYSGGSSVIYVSSTTAGPGNKEGHFLEVSNGVEQNIGVNSNASGGKKSVGVATGAQNSSVENIGVDAGATGNLNGSETNYGVRAFAFSGNKAYGGKFEARNGAVDSIGIWAISSQASGFNVLNRYSAQLQDGTEGEGKFLKSVTSDGKANWASLVTDVTHAQLVTRVNNSKLTQGTYYRITDYQTIYEQPDFIDMTIPVTAPIIKTGPIQPIIVLALKNNVLSEQAYQEEYPADTIKYQLEYNTKKTNTSTKGRIYERVDEYNNRTDFDHRNVLFKRYTTEVEYLDSMMYWYPFAYDSQPVEVLSFPLDSTVKNVYIEGNWNIKDSQDSIDQYATFFDLPNIVLGFSGDYMSSRSNLRIGNCANVTIGEIFSSEIKSIYCSAIKGVLVSNIGRVTQSLILIEISASTVGLIEESFLLSYGGYGIRESKIERLTMASLLHDYSESGAPSNPFNIYFQADIPQPQKYPPKFVVIDSILDSNIGIIYNIFNSVQATKLLNIRDNSKLYSGSSIFTPSTIYTKITVKNHLDKVISQFATVGIDSTGKASIVRLESGFYPRYDSSFDFSINYSYYYFETTTTNEIGKVPSNISEKVKYIPTINIPDGDYTGYIQIYDSNINSIDNSCISSIRTTNANKISGSLLGLVANSHINAFFGVSNDGRDDSRIIDCTFIGDVNTLKYSSMNNCYFKGSIRNSSFGENLGGGYGKLNEQNANLVSSDEFIFQDTQTGQFINPRSFTIDGNIFNADIVDAIIGDYVEGNIFNCKINKNIPDYFSNNTVNILPIIYLSNNDYLSNFKELAERSIKCEINPVFKTFSELSVPVTVGRSFEYDQNENPTYFDMRAVVFRVEANYLDDISRIWFLIDNTRIAADPPPPGSSFNKDSYLGESTVKPNTYNTYLKTFIFGPKGRLVSGTSTLLGKSRDNTSKLRKDSNTYLTMPENLSTIVDNIALNQPGTYSYNPAYSQNLNHLSVPTKADLELIYSLNLTQRTDIVWSSSEIDANNAWAFNFATGQSVSRPKDTSLAFLGIIDSIGLNTMELQYKRNSGVITKQFPVNI